MEIAEVKIYKRSMILKDEPMVYQADVWLTGSTEGHHGIGKTPAEALFNAAGHWLKHEKRKAE